MWKTGHSLIKARMRETGALLAGELAAHICFGDRYLPFDDAVYAGARLLELLHSTRQPLGGLLSDLPKVYSTPEVRVCCPEPDKFRLVQRIKDEFSAVLPVVDVDGVRLEFEDGWGLVRASNTQAALTLRFEAESEARVEEIRSVVVKKLEQLMRETCEGLKP
jgi:phosphomannomutase/phosphoglucomutase